MLYRHINITNYLRLSSHGFNKVIINLFRITVEDTDPGKTFNTAEPFEEFREHFLSVVKICAVNGCLLGNDIQLLNTLGSQ